MNAQAIYNAQFRNCVRSPQWKAGALRGLQIALAYHRGNVEKHAQPELEFGS